ncbi:hypothetical protein BSIN_3907 [Burkholderia singularis]|uniref:Uncharacterized protein n=1 Tax=Burkholderia singularis TaxID=1503053 RepID=A0A238H6G7_9BURK|nr:hypothetical protein BSIN_3907 [Burkholderia singularis]
MSSRSLVNMMMAMQVGARMQPPEKAGWLPLRQEPISF